MLDGRTRISRLRSGLSAARSGVKFELVESELVQSFDNRQNPNYLLSLRLHSKRI
jgi:hypothetical protein